ncbi:MAG: UpxY family transcription antiterminator [Bacteroidales bacterium]|nr:UpxY family transcription antiterminator [Bacteroidales bacterium]
MDEKQNNIGHIPPLKTEPVLHWYALYTKARAEKMVLGRLISEGYEAYLPIVKTLRVWSDRKKMVEVPLINSYIFVRTSGNKLYDIVRLDGITKYISFEGKPAVIPDYQIDNLRLIVNSDAKVDITGERISPGDPVEVTHGTLAGLKGELIKRESGNRVVVRIDRLDLNLVVMIPRAFLKKIQ